MTTGRPGTKVYTSRFIALLDDFIKKIPAELQAAEAELIDGEFKKDAIEISAKVAAFTRQETKKYKEIESLAVKVIEQQAAALRKEVKSADALVAIETKKQADIHLQKKRLFDAFKDRVSNFQEDEHKKYPALSKHAKKIEQLDESKGFVKKVHDKFFTFDSGKFNRIFDTTPVLVDKNVLKKWCDDYFEILSTIKLSKEKGAAGVHDISLNDRKKLERWMYTIIDTAYKDLFNVGSDGIGLTVKQEVVDYFSWKPDVKHDAQKIEKALQQYPFAILHAYAEVASSFVTQTLDFMMDGGKMKARLYLFDDEFSPDAWAAATRAVTFHQLIRLHFVHTVSKNPIEFAAREFFQKLSTMADTADSHKQLSHVIHNDFINLARGTDRKDKIKFWLQVISECIENNRDDHLSQRIDVLWTSFSVHCKSKDPVLLKDEQVRLQYEVCAEDIASRHIDKDLDEKGEELPLLPIHLDRWLNLRDNLLLIQEMRVLSETAVYRLNSQVPKEMKMEKRIIDKDEYANGILNYFFKFVDEVLYEKNKKDVLTHVIGACDEAKRAVIERYSERILQEGKDPITRLNLTPSGKQEIEYLDFLKEVAESLRKPLLPRAVLRVVDAKAAGGQDVSLSAPPQLSSASAPLLGRSEGSLKPSADANATAPSSPAPPKKQR